VKYPKINPKEATTFHNGEQNKLEDITKNIELENVQLTKNHPLELRCINTELKTPQKPIWDLTKKKSFGTMRPL
jgi:hypothetical protein